MIKLLAVKVLSLSKVIVTFTETLHSKLIRVTTNYGRPLSNSTTSQLHNFPQAPDLQRFAAITANIDGMTAPTELLALYYAVLLAPKGIVIEIGSWLGKSTVYIAKALEQKGSDVVYAIDTFEGNTGKESWYEAPLENEETIYDRFLKNISSANLKKFVKPLKVNSQKAAKNKNLSSASVIFIDGSHEYTDVKADILLWKNRVKKHGLLILHDYHPNFPGVIQAATETLKVQAFTPLFLCDTLLVFKKN